MRYPSATNRLRRGIASLELVLVFPMLLALVAILFAIAMSDVAKVQVTTKARQQTWAQRPSAPAGSPLDWVSQDPMASQIAPPQQQTVSLGPVYPGQTRQAQSKNTLVANPWASEAIPFPSLDKNMYPHTSVLTDLPLAKKQPLKLFLDATFTAIADCPPNVP